MIHQEPETLIQALGNVWKKKKEVRARRRHRVTLDPDVYTQIEDRARVRGILPETLVNLWLSEKLRETA